MSTDIEDQEPEERVTDLEKSVGRLETAITSFRWAGSALAAVFIVVMALNIDRLFTIDDRLADTRADIRELDTTVRFLHDDVRTLKEDSWVTRIRIERLSVKLGLEPEPIEKLPNRQ